MQCISLSAHTVHTNVATYMCVTCALLYGCTRLVSLCAAPPDAEPDVAGALIGIIVMQDLQRGLLMSLMPFFVGSYPQASWGYTLFLFVKLVLGFVALMVMVRVLTTRVLDGLYRYPVCVCGCARVTFA